NVMPKGSTKLLLTRQKRVRLLARWFERNMKGSLRDKARLNTLSATDLADIETSNYKDDIRSVLGQYLRASTAKIAVNFMKKPSLWNLFCKENYARKASELRNQETMGMTSSTYLTFRRARDL